MSRFSSARSFIASALVVLVVAACSGTKKDTYVEQPVDQLYNKAMAQLDDKSYESASKAFDEVDQQHPNSVWATKAQLMSAYALYQANKQDEAVVALDRFIQLHPAYKDTPYAYYLKALCYYEQIADIQRDQKITQQAMAALQEVVTRYPDSKYAHDARFKLDLVRDQLAGKELSIGRFYEKRHQYLAAINRYRAVVDHYQTTTQLPEALHRLTECYLALGLYDEAKKTAAVLGYNYPGSSWYQDSYDMVTTALPASAVTGAQSDQAVDGGDKGKAPPPGDAGWFDWVPWPF
jgi:outer membrane protein assembly factor BamD